MMTEYVRLGDVFDLQMGKTPSREVLEYWNNGDNAWVSISDLSNYSKYVGKTKETISNLGVEKSGIKITPPHTVIMSFKLSIGKTAITTENIYTNEAIMAFIPKGHPIYDTDYLYYMLSGIRWDKGVNKAVKGNTLNKKTISNYSVPLPPLEEQKRIAAALDTMSSVIAKRKQQIALLDEAAKSLFVEMFGDPVENPMGWDTVTVADVCKSIVGGGTPSKSHAEYYKGDIPWITPKDMKSLIISDSKDHITEEAIQNSATKLIPKDTVLMVVRSGILKHTLPVAITSRDVTLNQDMKAYITNEKTCPLYLLYFFKTMERKLLHKVKGTTADNLDFGMLKKLPYPLPPLDLQNLFASRIEALEAQRASCERGLKQMETVFAAMMQEYFG